MPTSQLFDMTNTALINGKWSQARALLDDLSRRRDNRDMLGTVESYNVPAMLKEVIGDRIELVNSNASF